MILINLSAEALRDLPVIEKSGDTTLRYNAQGVRYWLNEKTGWIQIDRREADAKFHIVAEYQG